MGGGSTRETSVQQSAPAPVWFPGQTEFIPEFVQPFKDIFAGNPSSVGSRLRTLASEGGMKEAAASRGRISQTKGMSTPARTAAYREAEDASVMASASTYQDAFNKALQVLQGFALNQPIVGNVSSGSSSGSGFNFKAFG